MEGGEWISLISYPLLSRSSLRNRGYCIETALLVLSYLCPNLARIFYLIPFFCLVIGHAAYHVKVCVFFSFFFADNSLFMEFLCLIVYY